MENSLPPNPGVLIVIVNYRTPELTIDCLRSLWNEISNLPRCRVDVVDNASGDNSSNRLISAIQAYGWNSRISILPLSHNGGFASGNNAAIRFALMSDDELQYVMLLNPDTIVQPGAVKALLEFMETNPGVGIAGSRLEGRTGVIQCSAYRDPTLLGELENGARIGILSRLLYKHIISLPKQEVPHECDWVSGAAMMVSRKVFEEIGLFDEGYFLYYEEVDFCFRARQAGWKVWHVPASRIIHLEGTSTGIGNHQRRRSEYWFASRRRFFLKNHGMGYATGADLARILGCVVWRFRRLIQLKTIDDPPYFLLDLIRYSMFTRGLN